MDKFRSLLPVSAIHPERSQEQASTEQIAALDTDMVRKVKDPDTCPAHLLPWLAWEFAVDSWEETWTEEEKEEEVARLKAEQGIAEVEEPGVNMAAGIFDVDLGGDGDAGQGNEPNILDEPKGVPGAAAGSQ